MWRRNGLSLVLLALMAVFLVAQALTGWQVHNEALSQHGAHTLGLLPYLATGHFSSATFENWESEFLQMGMYVLLTVRLRQRGSAESRPLDPSQEQPRVEKGRTPSPVRRGGVPNARSYALIMEDPDAANVKPFVHWVAYNIPASTLALPEGLPVDPRPLKPEGMLQGANSRGSVGYYGPKPPVGDSPHHYHFQVLALDTVLDLKPGATRDEVLKDAKGHILGVGETVGTYRQSVPPLK